jgi:hypothetical protein
MIEVKLLAECEDCPEFEVTQDSHCCELLDGREICQHTITCEHINKCRNLKAHLQREVNMNGN